MGKIRTLIQAHSRRFIIGGVVVALPLLALGWWLGSPLFLNRTVEEEFPLSANAAVPEGMTQQQVEDTMATLAMMDDEASEAMPEMMAEPAAEAVKRGMFRDGDSFHKGSGGAVIYQLPDGSHVLRLDDFRVTNGPDLRVILATHTDPQGRSDVHDGEYVELGKLKGNIGSQNYPIPDDVSVADFGSVIIYCKPFQVVFSVAPLAEG